MAPLTPARAIGITGLVGTNSTIRFLISDEIGILSLVALTTSPVLRLNVSSEKMAPSIISLRALNTVGANSVRLSALCSRSRLRNIACTLTSESDSMVVGPAFTSCLNHLLNQFSGYIECRREPHAKKPLPQQPYC